jgi:hypothetical protein
VGGTQACDLVDSIEVDKFIDIIKGAGRQRRVPTQHGQECCSFQDVSTSLPRPQFMLIFCQQLTYDVFYKKHFASSSTGLSPSQKESLDLVSPWKFQHIE